MIRKFLSAFVASAVLLGSLAPVSANDLSSGSKPGPRHVQGGKKKHSKKHGAKSAQKKSAKKAAKKSAKKLAKKGFGKGKKHGKSKA
jgi:hypothetical protein